ncbi:MAG: glycosyltransferase family 87 protein [Bacteroidetes bacterium]|nr:glycosyltransferase family 87 protein [Bacteroidota bacterium]MDA1224330.1 glycosyltransferase family 87 protein [Bacteroidota bacterium]
MRLFGLLYVAAIVFILLRNLSLPWGDLFADGGFYSHYNNYIIFKQSFFHLIAHKDLYIHYPLEQYDLFKYPPTFALLFAPFSVLPDFLGYSIWTGLNLLLPAFAIYKLQGISGRAKAAMSTLLLLEGFTSALNSQSNGLMLGLLLFAFVAMQNGRISQAVLFIWLTAFIKLFGVLFFAMLLVFPGAFKKSLLRIPMIFAGLYLLPLPILGWDGLQHQYSSMFNLLAHDHGFFVKYSVMGWLQQWFGLRPNKNLILMLGLGLQCIPLLVLIIKQKLWRSGSLQQINSKSLERWQFLFAASWLLWMVIFNHMAESATYVIAVGGAMLALSQIFSGSNPSMEGSNNSQAAQIVKHYVSSHGSWTFGFVILLLFTMLGPTDIYPKELRFWIVETAQLKAFPCILLWGMVLLEMFKVVRN